MTEVIGVRFKDGGKVYYFNPRGIPVKVGEHVIIETAKGISFGECALSNTMVDEMELISALRPVLRVATPEDMKRVESNRRNERRAYEIAQQKIQEHKLEMKLVEVKYSFDGSKILFYFTADGRVDFRHLVKDLASVFRTRIELRQIGVRDETKMMGGLGICGRPFCCTQFLRDFQPVSIKMAKTQNISLNPTKISGVCGRLMCCLKYEQDAYEDLLKDTPKLESLVRTPDGVGVVNQVQLLREQVKVTLDQDPDSPKLYHKADIEIIRNGKGKRPPGYEFPVAPPEKQEPRFNRSEPMGSTVSPAPAQESVSRDQRGKKNRSKKTRQAATARQADSAQGTASVQGAASAQQTASVREAASAREGGEGQKSGQRKSSRSRRHRSHKKSGGGQNQTPAPQQQAQGQQQGGERTEKAEKSHRSHRRRHHRPKGQGGAPKTENSGS